MSYYPSHNEPDQWQPPRDQRFPPHPSVRIQPHVRAGPRDPRDRSGRQHPPYPHPRYPRRPAKPPSSNGVVVQGFDFPRAPPSPHGRRPRYDQGYVHPPPVMPAPRQQRRRDPYRSTEEQQRYNMHKSYVSSVGEESSPGQTPQALLEPFPKDQRYSASVYTTDETPRIPDELPEELQSSKSVQVPETMNIPVQQHNPEPAPAVVTEPEEATATQPATKARQTKPPPLAISTTHMSELGDSPVPPTPKTRTAQMDALKAAIEASLREQPHEVQTTIQTPDHQTTVRMPFRPSPPISPVTPGFPLPRILQTAQHEDQPVEDNDNHKSSTSSSAHSNTALLGLAIGDPPSPDNAARSSRIPPSAQSNKAMVRDSTASLSELIRRATKLASNLEKGKTASRLGLNDFLSSGDGNRASWNPATGFKNADRMSKLPFTDFDKEGADDDMGKQTKTKSGRRCCGLSLPIFVLVLLAVIIVIAAAVLIPVFLVVIPRQQTGIIDLNHCAKSTPCANGGTSVVTNNQCSCVCANGFTGLQCTLSNTNANCTSMAFTDGTIQFKNATVGSSVSPVLANAQSQFSINLNATAILALFSSGNATCLNENSLVDFSSATTNTGRSMSKRTAESNHNLLVRGIHRLKHRSPKILDPREQATAVSATNGIIYAATTTAAPDTPASAAPTAHNQVPASSLVSRATPPSPAATPSQNTTSQQQQIDFAKVVVLYVLEQSSVLSVAVNAHQVISSYLASPNATTGPTHNGTLVDVGYGNLKLTADFGTFSITQADGSQIGELRS